MLCYYTPRGGQVTCRLVVQHNKAVLQVEDDGIGISEDQAELVVERRFYRADDSETEGSGLGLAIVQEIAIQHNARPCCGPNPTGKGAIASVTFFYLVPATTANANSRRFSELYRQSPPLGP